jgi:hypothetical protein
MSSIKETVNCHSGTIFLFDDFLDEIEKKTLGVQKTIVDNQFIDVITEQGE